MTKYLLVSFKTCPWVQRAAIVLREKKVDFEFRHITSDNRPDWFKAISPHNKVPVVRIDDRVSLFESNAICEYFDDTIQPRLHPQDPIQRALHRAWTDFLPTFGGAISGVVLAKTEADYAKAVAQIPGAFEKLEKALETQGAGPFFDGERFSMVDASYAPFLQRYTFLDRIRPLGHLEKFPRLTAWRDAVLARPTVHSFPPAELEALYRGVVKERKGYVSQFVPDAQAAE